MTDDFKELREALDAGPTGGPWALDKKNRFSFSKQQEAGMEPIGFVYGPAFPERSEHGKRALATSRFIAAANPAVIRSLLDRLEAAERDAERPPKIPNRIPLPHQSACDIEYSSGFDMGYAQGWNEAIDAMKEQQP